MSEIESELVELGYQILAVAPSLPGRIVDYRAEHGYRYRIFSDGDFHASDAFGLTWRMPEDQVEQYRGWGIDLEAESGRDNHLLPVPAAYLIGTDGVIDFAYVNPNHAERVAASVLLAAARAARAE